MYLWIPIFFYVHTWNTSGWCNMIHSGYSFGVSPVKSKLCLSFKVKHMADIHSSWGGSPVNLLHFPIEFLGLNIFYFHPYPSVEMIQFDLRIFFKWVGSTTNMLQHLPTWILWIFCFFLVIDAAKLLIHEVSSAFCFWNRFGKSVTFSMGIDSKEIQRY